MFWTDWSHLIAKLSYCWRKSQGLTADMDRSSGVSISCDQNKDYFRNLLHLCHYNDISEFWDQWLCVCHRDFKFVVARKDVDSLNECCAYQWNV